MVGMANEVAHGLYPRSMLDQHYVAHYQAYQLHRSQAQIHVSLHPQRSYLTTVDPQREQHQKEDVHGEVGMVEEVSNA